MPLYKEDNMSRGKMPKKSYLRFLLCDVIFVVFGVAIFTMLHFSGVLAVPTSLSVNPTGYTSTNSFTIDLTGDVPTSPNGIVKYQYRTDSDGLGTSGAWTDYDPPLSTTVNVLAYTEGVNTFLFQAIDGLGNVVDPISKQYLYNYTPPTEPNNLVANPTRNDVNSFYFTWAPPSTFFATDDNANNLTYYYSVNALPTENNVTLIQPKGASSLPPGPFATQRGTNWFYLVTKDEAGNINYQNKREVSFEANTAGPGAPTNIEVNDISNKEPAPGEYRLAISWNPSETIDPENLKAYDVYSSVTAIGPFFNVASTRETAFVQTGLTKDVRYYYYVVATDKTGNFSAPSSIVNAVPIGKYKRAPYITREPEATAKSKKATISWVTEREANSFIEYGTTSALGYAVGNGTGVYKTDHSVFLTNLTPSTKYYYRAVFTDPDGNTGNSNINTFTTDSSLVVSGFVIDEITTSSMRISWDTNVLATSKLRYGKNSVADYEASEAAPSTKHSLYIKELQDDTFYHIQIKQTDNDGNEYLSDEYSATTLALPRVTTLTLENQKESDSPTTIVEYETNVPTSTEVENCIYGALECTTSYTSELVTKHQATLTGLYPNKLYTATIRGRDSLGNQVVTTTKDYTTLTDIMPPRLISLIERKDIVGEGSNAVASINLELVTNEESKVVVEISRGTSGTVNYSKADDTVSRSHNITVEVGKPDSPYFYRTILTDSSGNKRVGDLRAFVMPRPENNTLDFVSRVFGRSFGWMSKYLRI